MDMYNIDKFTYVYTYIYIQVPPMLTTVGVLDPPLGNTRLQVVKLFCALLQCNDSTANREIAALKTFSTLMVRMYVYSQIGIYVCMSNSGWVKCMYTGIRN